MRARALFLGLMVAAGAHAVPSADSAKEFYAAGRDAFAAGEYEQALENFEYTFLCAASPNAAFNIAAALEHLGRHHEAAVALERYLQLSPQPDDKVKKRAESDRLKAGESAPTAPLDEARRAFAAGRYAFEQKDFDTAVNELLRSYLLAPQPEVVLNAGAALEAAGRFHRAALVFDRFLELAPPKNDEERKSWERTRARADALRYRREVAAAAPPAPTGPTAEVPREADNVRVNVIVHGPAFNPDKEKRCYAAVRQGGIDIDLDAPLTAVLTLGKTNRLQIVHRDRGILRDEERPRWGMEQLCLDAAQTALTTSRR